MSTMSSDSSSSVTEKRNKYTEKEKKVARKEAQRKYGQKQKAFKAATDSELNTLRSIIQELKTEIVYLKKDTEIAVLKARLEEREKISNMKTSSIAQKTKKEMDDFTRNGHNEEVRQARLQENAVQAMKEAEEQRQRLNAIESSKKLNDAAILKAKRAKILNSESSEEQPIIIKKTRAPRKKVEKETPEELVARKEKEEKAKVVAYFKAQAKEISSSDDDEPKESGEN